MCEICVNLLKSRLLVLAVCQTCDSPHQPSQLNTPVLYTDAFWGLSLCFEPSYLSHITKRLQLKVEIKYGLVWAVNLKRFFCKKVKTFHWGSQVLLTVQKPVWVTRCQFCSSNHLEKSLQLLMDRVDDMSQDIVKYNTYSRNLSKQQQQKHQVTLECMNAPWHTHTHTQKQMHLQPQSQQENSR